MEKPSPWSPPEPLPLPLRTERVLLDAYREEDAPALYRAVSEHREAIGVWMPWAHQDHFDVEESLDRIRKIRTAHRAADPTDFVVAILSPDRTEVLGGTGFHRIDRDTLTAEVGYWIRPDRQRQGLAPEAVGALITSGFQDWGFRRIVVLCNARNRPSQRVAETLGLRLEMHLSENHWRDDVGWSDDLGYACLASEWDPARQRGPATYAG